MIDLRGLDKAEVLAALYNHSKAQGMGFVDPDYTGPARMSRGEAERYLAGGTYFDYLRGRAMKVELGGDELDPRLYDRDLGQGAAARAVAAVRAGGRQ